MDDQSKDRRQAHTIDEFCENNRISRSAYYNLKKDGLGPREMRCGRKPIITPEAEDDWRRMMERLTAEAGRCSNISRPEPAAV